MDKKMIAVRNLDLCTKDCLCLYVCPYGATDTENSIIDKDKCVGCGICALSCPSKAISMVPIKYPPQQVKNEKVIKIMNGLSKSKTIQEKIALQIAEKTKDKGLKRLMYAIAKSNRLMAEDILRESGYMLPQRYKTNKILKEIKNDKNHTGVPIETDDKLLDKIEVNDA